MGPFSGRSVPSPVAGSTPAVTEVGDRLPHGDPGGRLGELHRRRLGHERDRAAGAGVGLDHVEDVVLDRVLDVHQSAHADAGGQLLRRVPDLQQVGRAERDGRQGAGRVAGVDPGLLDVLHDPAEVEVGAVEERVDVDLDGVLQEPVDQHGVGGAQVGGLGDVGLERGVVVDDLHPPAAQHVGRPDQHRIADGRGDLARLGEGRRHAVLRRREPGVVQHPGEGPAVLRVVDGFGRGAQHRDPGVLEPLRQAQRRLPAERADDPGHRAGRALGLDHLEDVLEGERLEVEPVGGVVVGGDGLGVAVDHHRLVAGVLQRHDRVHAGVVELDALADPVGPRAQDQHRLLLPRLHLVLLVVGRVVVGRGGGELCGAGVDRLVDRPDAEPPAQHPDAVLTGELRPERGDLAVGEPVPLAAAQQLRGQGRRVADLGADLGDQRYLVDEPWIETTGGRYVFDRGAGGQRLLGEVEPAVDGHPQGVEEFLDRPLVGRTRPEARDLGLGRPHRLAQRLGEVPAHGHDLADALHGRRQPRVGAGELLEGEPRDLDDHVVQRRLEGGRGDAGDVVGDLVEGVADGQLRGDLGDREAGGLGRQRARPRHPRVHLDDDEAPRLRVHGELDVAAAGVDPDRAQHRDADVAHLLVLAVGEGHRRRDGHRVAGVHAHRVDVLDRADDDHVVAAVAHELELVFLPPEHRLLDEDGVHRGVVEAVGGHPAEHRLVGGDARAEAAHGEAGPDDDRVADLLSGGQGRVDRAADRGARGVGADRPDDVLEDLPVLAAVDRVHVGADELDAVLLQDAVLEQADRDVERGLPTEGGQQCVRALRGDDLLDELGGERLDVGRVGDLGVGHDRRGVAVDQADPQPLGAQHPAGLGARVVELGGLADEDRPGADDHHVLDVGPLRHCAAPPSGRRTAGRAGRHRADRPPTPGGTAR